MTDKKEDLFEADQPQIESPSESPTPAASDQLLASIVNDEGLPKYSSVEDALKALQSAQEHIKRIEGENADYREKVTKATTMEDILKALKPGEAAPAPAAIAPKNTEELDIESVVIKALEDREAKQVQQTNTQTVVTKIKELYGEKASEIFYQKAEALGIGKADINALAQKSPAAVFRLLGIEAKQSTPTVSGIRSEALTTQTSERPTHRAMAHGSSAALVSAWKQTQEKVNKRLGL